MTTPPITPADRLRWKANCRCWELAMGDPGVCEWCAVIARDDAVERLLEALAVAEAMAVAAAEVIANHDDGVTCQDGSSGRLSETLAAFRLKVAPLTPAE